MAIPLEASVREALYEAAAPLRAAAPRLRWVPAERLHLTVKFLGDTEPAHVGPLVAALGEVAGRHRDVPLVLRGAGAFPTLRRPRVVWCGVDPDPRLELLQHDVEEACAAVGFPVEGRAFRPHVTLARVKVPADAGGGALARAAGAFAFEDEGTASSLDLMESTLTREGATYRCLLAAPLRAG